MAEMSARPPAILVLGEGSLPAARRAQSAIEGARIYGLSGRVAGADFFFEEFATILRRLFLGGVPIAAFCAAGTVIRLLAPVLRNKRAAPPVLAVAKDGSAVVPLLGGRRGGNALARMIGDALGATPAITAAGEVRFAATRDSPPAGCELRNPNEGERFMPDLRSGERIRETGAAPRLSRTRLPFDSDGRLSIVVARREREPAEPELFDPRSIAVGVAATCRDLPRRVMQALERRGLSARAVGVVLAAERDAAQPEVHAAAAALARPLRLVSIPEATTEERSLAARLVMIAVPAPAEGPFDDGPVALAVASSPIAAAAVGRARGRLAVVGLGPGGREWMVPAARKELAAADDIVGYLPYLQMAGPFGKAQAVHASNNREEMERARHALALAAQGRSVAVVSSGDPGIFAMAAAVMEALHESRNPAWHGVEVVVIPGVSAAQAAAARAGAPLGHDFCVLSLSDNLKPWDIIERRLDHAAAADMVLALYNPISRARPWQFGRALEVVRGHRAPETPVVLGRDLGRPGESIRIVPLGALAPAQVDMRTVVIIGSSTTRGFPRLDGSMWVYTPRWYGRPPTKLSAR
jgi:cobalt-precorrin 5A hydrolase/precorrin-3B C17-methyltransferase